MCVCVCVCVCVYVEKTQHSTFHGSSPRQFNHTTSSKPPNRKLEIISAVIQQILLLLPILVASTTFWAIWGIPETPHWCYPLNTFQQSLQTSYSDLSVLCHGCRHSFLQETENEESLTLKFTTSLRWNNGRNKSSDLSFSIHDADDDDSDDEKKDTDGDEDDNEYHKEKEEEYEDMTEGPWMFSQEYGIGFAEHFVPHVVILAP